MAAAALVGGGVMLAAAPAASAATQTIAVDCSTPYVLGITKMITASPGDTLTFSGTGCTVLDIYNPDFDFLFVDPNDQVSSGPYSVTIRNDVPMGVYVNTGLYVVAVGNIPNGELFSLTVVAAAEASTSKPIPPWVQGYGRGSATDVCNDGWTASWELWPHGGSGGWVCTREIPSLG